MQQTLDTKDVIITNTARHPNEELTTRTDYLVNTLHLYNYSPNDIITETGEWIPSIKRAPDWVFSCSIESLPPALLTLKAEAWADAFPNTRIDFKALGIHYTTDEQYPFKAYVTYDNPYITRAIEDRQTDTGEPYRTTKKAIDRTILPYGTMCGFGALGLDHTPLPDDTVFIQYPSDAVAKKTAPRINPRVSKGITDPKSIPANYHQVKPGVIARASHTDYSQMIVRTRKNKVLRQSTTIIIIDIDTNVNVQGKINELRELTGIEPSVTMNNLTYGKEGHIQLAFILTPIRLTENTSKNSGYEDQITKLRAWFYTFFGGDMHAANCRMQNPHSGLFNRTDTPERRDLIINNHEGKVIVYNSVYGMIKAIKDAGLWNESKAHDLACRIEGTPRNDFIIDRANFIEVLKDTCKKHGFNVRKIEDAAKKTRTSTAKFLESLSKNGGCPAQFLTTECLKEQGLTLAQAENQGFKVPFEFDCVTVRREVEEGRHHLKNTQHGTVIPRQLRDLPLDGSLPIAFINYIMSKSNMEFDLTGKIPVGKRNQAMMFITGKLHGLGASANVMREVLKRVDFEQNGDNLDAMIESVVTSTMELPRTNEHETSSYDTPIIVFTSDEKLDMRAERAEKAARYRDNALYDTFTAPMRKSGQLRYEALGAQGMAELGRKGGHATAETTRMARIMNVETTMHALFRAKPVPTVNAHRTWDDAFVCYKSDAAQKELAITIQDVSMGSPLRARLYRARGFCSARALADAFREEFGSRRDGSLGYFPTKILTQALLSLSTGSMNASGLTINDAPKVLTDALLAMLNNVMHRMVWFREFTEESFVHEWRSLVDCIVMKWRAVMDDEYEELKTLEPEFTSVSITHNNGLKINHAHNLRCVIACWAAFRDCYDTYHVVQDMKRTMRVHASLHNDEFLSTFPLLLDTIEKTVVDGSIEYTSIEDWYHSTAHVATRLQNGITSLVNKYAVRNGYIVALETVNDAMFNWTPLSSRVLVTPKYSTSEQYHVKKEDNQCIIDITRDEDNLVDELRSIDVFRLPSKMYYVTVTNRKLANRKITSMDVISMNDVLETCYERGIMPRPVDSNGAPSLVNETDEEYEARMEAQESAWLRDYRLAQKIAKEDEEWLYAHDYDVNGTVRKKGTSAGGLSASKPDDLRYGASRAYWRYMLTGRM